MDNQVDTKRITRISKTMSWILRHGINELGLKIDELGRIPLKTLLEQTQMKDLNVLESEVIQVVQTNDKQRFRLDLVGETLWIGANQGHSKDVGEKISTDKLMELITEPVDLCVHGTYSKFIDSIKKTGLKSMGRTHIHMATGFAGDHCVISGARSSANVFIKIDMKSAMDDGIKFYRSSNGVILSEGIDGTIEPKYFLDIIYK